VRRKKKVNAGDNNFAALEHELNIRRRNFSVLIAKWIWNFISNACDLNYEIFSLATLFGRGDSSDLIKSSLGVDAASVESVKFVAGERI
jgi:hypothetical protein